MKKNVQSLVGQTPGTDSASSKTRPVLCPEYVLETERVIYCIRPRDQKHPRLLPVGEQAPFRLQNDKVLLGVGDLQGKQREYIVRSMTPSSDSSTADASTSQ